MTLFDQIYGVIAGHIDDEDAFIVADALAELPPRVRAELFEVFDNHEPSEAAQGLTPIPEGYAEQ